MNKENKIYVNTNMDKIIDEIKTLRDIDIEINGKQKYQPTRLMKGGKPTKLALAYNRRLIKEGKTFNYLDQSKLVKISDKGNVSVINKKFDTRFKTPIPIQSQKDVYGSVISKGNLKNKTDPNYENVLTKQFKNNKDSFDSTVKVDLKKISLSKLLTIVSQFNSKTNRYIINVDGSPNWITLSSNNIQRLKNYQSLLGSDFKQSAGSDNMFIFELDANPNVTIKLIQILDKDKPQGSFFKYYHNMDMDLTKYDIHSEAPENYNNNCLYIALKNGGLEQAKLNDMKEFVKCGSVPSCKLTQICDKLDIKITIRKPNYNGKLLKFGTKGEIFSLGLIDNHYFIIEKSNLTSYAIDHYDAVKDIKDWNRIYKKSKDGYQKSNDRFIDSYQVIIHLIKNKDNLLTPIPTEDILSTQYFNLAEDNENLDYTKDKCCKENVCNKGGKEQYPICYFDFETSTEQDKHIPYMCCANFLDNKATFYGEDCGKDLINWIKYICKKNKFDDIILVAHNLRYDYTFIMDHIYCLKPVMKGNSIMGGSGRIYSDKTTFTNVHFLDSYNLISTKLSAFSGMFDLPITKEIMPYSIYTVDNVKSRYVLLEVMLEHINKDDHEQFITNINKWNCLVDDEVDIIKYSEEYCKIDVEVLKIGFETFKKWIHEVTGLNIKNYCSIASLGLDYIVKEECFEDCFKICGRPRDFIQNCVVGGRCMTRDNKKWKTEKEVADFDAVSLYPSAMERMDGILKGSPKVIKNKSFEWLKNNSDGFFIKAICLNNPTINRGFPLLSKHEGEVRNFTNETKNEVFYLDKTLYEECVKHQGLEFKILCGYYYNEGHNNKINSVIRHLFNARIEAKKLGNPIQAIYKLLMNSCYGKCLLKPINNETEIVYKEKWDKYFQYNYNYIRDFTEMKNAYVVNKVKPINEHFNNVYAGVEILSMSKRIMNEVMCLAEDMKLNMYITDTDSIHIDNDDIKELSIKFNSIYNRELIGKGMGQFHTDFDLGKCDNVIAVQSVFLGKKAYIDKLQGTDKEGNKQIGYHVRMKGVSSAAIEHYCDKYNIGVMDVYTDLFETGSLPKNRFFDLLAGGKACKFQYNKDMSVSSVSDFSRKVNFNYEKGILA